MVAVKHIQCPSCGSASTFKTSQGHYKCNYCQTSIIVNEESPQKPENSHSIPQADGITVPAQIGVPKFIKLILIFVFTIVLGVGFAVFTITSNVSPVTENTAFTEWQKPSLNHYECFTGSKGPVAWVITQQTRNKLDSTKYIIKIIDPSKQKILEEKSYLPNMTWKESFDINKKISNEFLLINDWAYNASEDNLLVAYDIYTFDIKEDANDLQKKFSELSSGISKTEIIRYKHAFKLITNNGDEFVYYPKRGILRTQQEDNLSYRTDTITVDQMYLHQKENQMQLWRIMQITDAGRVDNEMEITDYGLEEIAGKNNRNHGYIKLAKQVNDKKFFKAQGLTRYKNNFTLIYAESLSKKAKVILESFNLEGKSNWQIAHPDLQALIESPFQTLNCDYNTNGNLLIININGAKRKSVCFDLEKGKPLWTYSIE